jgi:hypothetical protein
MNSLALAPVSPVRLRVLGLFSVYLEVDVKSGVVTLERNGVRVRTWKRSPAPV